MPLTQITTSNIDTTNSLFFRNRILNGDMRINQRGFSGTPSHASYLLDRYFYNASATRITVSQSSNAPAGFTNSMLVTSNAASSIGTSDYTNLCQIIEGTNIADLAWGTTDAKPVTLSFWVKSSVTGTFGGAVRNAGTGGYWGYPFTYNINSANIWEYKTITIPGPTNISYTWETNNNQGIYIWWDFGTGSTYTAPAGTWVNKNTVGADSTTKLVNTNGATWYMTGAQLEVGTAATAFERRPYGMELALCQRYYSKLLNPHLNGVASNASNVNRVGGSLPVTMRAAPSITYSGTMLLYDGNSSLSATSCGSIYSTPNYFEFDATLSTGTTTIRSAISTYIDGTVTGTFSISAEL
jgi:hypothetical protein